jgi:hypothetical protein
MIMDCFPSPGSRYDSGSRIATADKMIDAATENA